MDNLEFHLKKLKYNHLTAYALTGEDFLYFEILHIAS